MTRKEFRRKIVTRPEENCSLMVGGRWVYVDGEGQIYTMYSPMSVYHHFLNWTAEVRRQGYRREARRYLKTCQELREGNYALAA